MEKWGLQFRKLVPKVKAKDVAKSWKIFTGDTVRIISGAEKGLECKVEDVLRKHNKVILAGANLAKVHVKPENSGIDRGFYIVEKGIHISNVSLIDPVTKKPTKVFWKIDDTGRKMRISKDSGAEIPKPPPPVIKREAGPFDTNPDVVKKKTYFPSLLTAPLPPECTHF
jgi:large subunit ribosomal protein L24